MRLKKYLYLAGILSSTLSFSAISAQEVEGEKLYTMYCTQCHGINGDGKGVNSATMSVQPRSHIDRTEMLARSDEELYKVIEQGGKSIDKSNLMPAWSGNLNDEEITALVSHLRDLCCKE